MVRSCNFAVCDWWYRFVKSLINYLYRSQLPLLEACVYASAKGFI